jgi:cystathionine beta-lyase
MFDFDKIVERRGTGSLKWDDCADPEVLPMWVADMDFETAPVVKKAVLERAGHGVFGYVRVP